MNKKTLATKLAALVLGSLVAFGAAACGESSSIDDPINTDDPVVDDGGGTTTLTEDSYETTVSTTSTVSGSGVTDGKYYADYESYEDTLEASAEINKEIGAEGMVLLKNENNALPLGKSETKVSLFGHNSTNLKTGGGGSGSGIPGVYGIETTTLRMSLEDAGFKINEKLYTAYSLYADDDLQPDPSKVITSSIKESFGAYDDAAIVVLSRVGSEGSDLDACNVDGHSDTTDHYLMLEDNEKEMIRMAKKYFNKVIVLLNSAHIMDLDELNAPSDESDLGVDAIIQIGHVGNDAADAIGKILNGDINPSGHTVDTWMADFTKSPSWTNFGTGEQVGEDNYLYVKNSSGELVACSSDDYHSVEYREDIYVGYRYYETVAHDMDEEAEGTGETWYNENVVYPFGYGLSYTTFSWELDSSISQHSLISKANSTVTMKVKVTNTGDYAGKDVVQIYASAPYYKGGIEKASDVLVGFAKTSELKPGQSEVVTIQFVAQDMASYDWADANGNGFSGYELEAGDYIISAKSNSHDTKLSVTRTIESTILCKTDYTTGNEIQSWFSQTEGEWAEYNSTNESLLSNLMTRDSDMAQPAASTKEDRTISDELYDWLEDRKYDYGYEDDPSDRWYADTLPSNWTQADSHESDYSDVLIKLKDMVGVTYTDYSLSNGTVVAGSDADSQKWETFLNQLTWDEMVAIVSDGGYGRPGVDSIEKPTEADMDGPSQLAWMISGMPFFNTKGATNIGTAWASAVLISSTWNQDLAYEHGRAVGNESLFCNSVGWYGPAMNIHRNPLAGRNFEYYSEDGVQAGLMASKVTRGATDKGVVCYLKHIFLNDQETNRDSARGIFTYATEQAIREIYAKPFEYCIKYGGAMGTMNGNNRIGNWCAYSNGALHDGLLRSEWNFKGITLTDGWVQANWVHVNSLLRNGVDLPLSNATGDIETSVWKDGMVYMAADEDDTNYTMASPTQWYVVRRAVLHILYVSANTNGLDNGLKTSNTVTYNLTGGVENNIQLLNEENYGTSDIQNFTIDSGTLPTGLSISEYGYLTGTAMESGEFTVVVSCVGDGWVDTSWTIIIKVDDLFTVTGLESDLKKGSEATIVITASGMAVGDTYEKDGTTYAIETATYSTADTLPEGLTLNSDGTISGTPTTAGTYTISVTLHITSTEQGAAFASSASSEDKDVFTQTITIVVSE